MDASTAVVSSTAESGVVVGSGSNSTDVPCRGGEENGVTSGGGGLRREVVELNNRAVEKTEGKEGVGSSRVESEKVSAVESCSNRMEDDGEVSAS